MAAPARTRRLAARWHFFRVALEFERPLESWSPVLAKSVLLDAVRTLHGQLGAGLWEPQLLHFDPASREAIVAVPASGAAAARGAFTLCAQYDGKACRLRVLQDSAFLLSLAERGRRVG